MALKECEKCKAEIVFYSKEITTCPHCSHRHFLGSGITTYKMTDIPRDHTPGISDKSFWATLVFFVFFLGFGAHRLYVGKIQSGLFYPLAIISSSIYWFELDGSENNILDVTFIFVGFCLFFLIAYDFFSLILGKFKDADGNFVTTDSDLGGPTIIQTNVESKSPPKDVAQEIKKFSDLKDEGLITEDEFNKKKEELLNQ
tara:strand:+ start:83 stop:682 length:600 start_codon:yes stop_codon:yes gene_type:complete